MPKCEYVPKVLGLDKWITNTIQMAYLLQSAAMLTFYSKMALTSCSRQCFSAITELLHRFRSVLQSRNIWCGFDRASSLIWGNKMPTRCNRGFFLQILLLAEHVSGTTMPIIRSSRVLYNGCCLWYFVLWFSSCFSNILKTWHITLSSTPDQQLEYHRQQPFYNTW